MLRCFTVVPASGKCSLSWTSIMYLKHGILSYFFNSSHKSLLITFKAPHLHGYNHRSQSLVSGLIANPCPLLIDPVQLGKSRQYCGFPTGAPLISTPNEDCSLFVQQIEFHYFIL